MKTLTLTILLGFILNLNASSECDELELSSPKIEMKAVSVPKVTLKYIYSQISNFEFKYEIKVPLSFDNLPFLNFKTKKSRFDSKKAIYQPRFQNLKSLDLNAIVERNKIYNASKNFKLKSY